MSDDRFGYGEIGMDTSHCADATAYAMMCKPKFITNADRIRAMTDEELAELLRDYQCNTCDFLGFCEETDKCKEEIFKWLKERASDG